MRSIQLYDTLGNAIKPLQPRDPGKVAIYACGPTVYSRIHIGNARPYVVFMLLKRYLEHEAMTSLSRPTSPTSTTRFTSPRARRACTAPNWRTT